ncbi:MAG: endonuclease/exonuclease/phosphatase family protein, partial [Calditrichia bacterium]
VALFTLLVLLSFLFFCDYHKIYDLALIAGLAILLIYQAYLLFPYLPFYPVQSHTTGEKDPEHEISIMVSNVLQFNREAESLLKIVREVKPDLLLCQETNQWWEAHLKELEADYPFRVKEPLDNTYGMLFYSRLQLIDTRIDYLVEQKVPSLDTRIKLRSGHYIRFRGLHPRPPRPSKLQHSTQRDAELIKVGKELRDFKRPVIVAGDFNDVPWSYSTRLFQKISKLLDPRKGRGIFPTFSTNLPFFLRFPLDQVFHSDHFRVVQIETRREWGSDHLPYLVKLHYDPVAVNKEAPPEPDGDDWENAREMEKRAKEELPDHKKSAQHKNDE